jgi:hypothetical protein
LTCPNLQSLWRPSLLGLATDNPCLLRRQYLKDAHTVCRPVPPRKNAGRPIFSNSINAFLNERRFAFDAIGAELQRRDVER